MRQIKEVRVTVEFDNGETFTVIDRPLPVAFTDDNRYLGQEFSRGMDGCQIAGHRIIEGYFPGQVLKAQPVKRQPVFSNHVLVDAQPGEYIGDTAERAYRTLSNAQARFMHNDRLYEAYLDGAKELQFRMVADD